MKGGQGSHWEGCEESHHDCALRLLDQALKVIALLLDALVLARELRAAKGSGKTISKTTGKKRAKR